MKVATLLLLCIAGCGPGKADFGAVTEDGIDEVKQFCGANFEYQSLWHEVPQSESPFPEIRNAKKLLVLHCHVHDSGTNRLDIAIEADSKKLLMLQFTSPVPRFDAVVDRAIVPALDDDLRGHLTALRTWLRSQPRTPATELHNRWYGRGIYLAVDVYPYEGGSWHLDIGHTKDAK